MHANCGKSAFLVDADVAGENAAALNRALAEFFADVVHRALASIGAEILGRIVKKADLLRRPLGDKSRCR